MAPRIPVVVLFGFQVMARVRWWVCVACLCAFLLSAACVPQGEYLRLEAECESQVKREADRRLKAIEEKERELAGLREEIQDLKTECEQCRQEIETYRSKAKRDHKTVRELEKTNKQLVERLKKLHQDIEKRQSIITLQSRVIRTLDDTKKTIETSLRKEIEAQGIQVEDMEGRIKVRFVDRILFDSGKADLNPQGRRLLKRFADSVRVEPTQLIQVRGYTDNTPIGPVLKRRFASNWELSAARALAVVHFLQKEAHLSPTRLSACALGPYRPIADNATEQGRRLNRRIEIIIYPEDSPFALPETKAPRQSSALDNGAG